MLPYYTRIYDKPTARNNSANRLYAVVLVVGIIEFIGGPRILLEIDLMMMDILHFLKDTRRGKIKISGGIIKTVTNSRYFNGYIVTVFLKCMVYD